MRSPEALEILHSIIEAWLGSTVVDDAPLMSQVNDASWSQKLSRAIQEELDVAVTANEIESAGALLQLSNLLESRLAKDPMGRSLVEIYATVEQIAREEYHPDIGYHWYARWNDFLKAGNWLTAPDGLDAVEIVMRMEEEFGFSIPNQDAEAMETVGQTVRYLWRRSCARDFALRQRASDVCRNAYIFYEVRRLLMARGGVPRAAVRLDARLGELLPSWYAKFWEQVQRIFRVDLPQSRLLTFNRKMGKRTTVKELVSLMASSQAARDTAPAPQRGA